MANDDKKKRLHEVAKRNFEYVPVDYEEFSKKASNPDFSRRLSQDLLELEKGGFIKKAPTYEVLISAFGATPAPTATTATPATPKTNVVPGGGQQAQARTFPTPSELQRGISNQPLPNVGVPPMGVQPEMPPDISGIPGQAPVGGQPGAQESASQGGVNPLAGAQPQQFQWSGQQAPVESMQPQQPVSQGVGGISSADSEARTTQVSPYQAGITKLGEVEAGFIGGIGSGLQGISELGYSIDSKIVNALEGTPLEGGFKKLNKPSDSWLYQAGQGLQDFAEKDLYRNPEYVGGFSSDVAGALGQVGSIMATGGFNPAGGILKLGKGVLTNRQLIANGVKQLFSRPTISGAFQMVGAETQAARELHNMANTMDKESYVLERATAGEDADEAGRAYDKLRTKTEDEVASAMIPVSLFGGALEAIPLERLFVRLGKPAKNYIVSAFKNGGIQGVEEATQEVIQQTIINAGVGNTYNEAQKLTTGLQESAEVGGAVGFILGATLTALGGKRANIRNRVQEGVITKEQAIEELKDINKAETLIQDKLQALDNQVGLSASEDNKKLMESPEAQQFFDNNKPSETNPIVAMPTEVETVLDKIADDILISPEGLHEAYQWTNNAVKETLENDALTPAEKGATLNILNGMLGDIDKANTEGQKFVEEVEVASVQDRVPAVRPEAELPKGQAPKAPASAPQAQGESIRQARRVRGGTNVLPSSGEVIVTPNVSQVNLPSPQGFNKALKELGYTDEDIASLSFEQQQDIVTNKTEKAEVASSAKVPERQETGGADLESQKRIGEIESMLAQDAKSMQETGMGMLIPEARAELQQELNTLKSQQSNESKTEQQEEPVLGGVSDGGNQGQGGQAGSQLRSQESPQQAEGDAEGQVTTGTPEALVDTQTVAEANGEKLGFDVLGNIGNQGLAIMDADINKSGKHTIRNISKASESQRVKIDNDIKELQNKYPNKNIVNYIDGDNLVIEIKQPETSTATKPKGQPVVQASPEAKPESPAQQGKAPEGATQGKAEAEVAVAEATRKLEDIDKNAWGTQGGLSENFYTTDVGGYAIRKPINNPSSVTIDGIDFHVAKIDGDWKVIEKVSGLEVSTGKIKNTKESAIEDAIVRIKQNGGAKKFPALIDKAIQGFKDRNIKNTSIKPLFEGVKKRIDRFIEQNESPLSTPATPTTPQAPEGATQGKAEVAPTEAPKATGTSGTQDARAQREAKRKAREEAQKATEAPEGKPKAMTDYEARLEERRQAYKPGNTVITDTGKKIKVIEYTENPNDPNDWSVTTQDLDVNGNPVGKPINHKTPPTKKEIQRSGFKTAEEIKKSSVLPNDNKSWADKFSSLVEDQKQSAKEQAKDIPKDSDVNGVVLKSGLNWKDIRKAFALPFKALDIGNRPISIAYVKFEDAVSKLVARGMRNSNKYYSGALNVLQGFAKNIAKTSAQVKQTRESMGAVADAVNTAISFYNNAVSIVNGDATSLQRVHQVLDPEVYESAIQNGKAQKVELADLTPEEMNLHNALRTALDMIHEWHFANGFIKQKTYDKFKGKYIPRFWNDAGLTGQTETDLLEFARISKGINTEYIKKRKEIDDMGLDIIEDPVYATATRMAQMLRNQAFLDYANALSNTDKVYDGPDDMAPPSYIKLEGAKYGDLNGKWVSRDIAEDFDGYFLTNKFANMAYDLAKKWARIPLVRGIKESKTVYDITVFLGNMTNNITMAFVTGVDPVNLLSRVDEGIKAIKEKDADYRYLVQQGVLGTDIVSNEIGMYTSGAPTQQLANQSIKDGLLSITAKIMDKAKEAYGGADDVAKIASFKSLVNDYGLSREEAAARVYDGLQNYGRVGRYFDVASKTPIVGNPYVKFAGDLGIMTKNALAKRPLNTIAFYMLLQGVAQLASRLSDEDEELKEAREARSFIPKIALPKTLNEMGIKDAPLTFMAGDTELNVARFISPYYIYDVGDHGYLGTLQEASKFAPIQITESESGLPMPKIGDPVLGPIISLFMDRDFRNKPILDPTKNKFYAGDLEGNPLAKTVNAIEYLSHAWIPYYPKISAIYSGLAGEEDYYGRKRDIKDALVNVVIKTQKMTRTEVMEKYKNDIEYKVNAIEGIEKDMATAYNKAIKGIDEVSANKDLTENQKAKRIETIQNNFYVREAKRQEEIAKIWQQALESEKYLIKAEGKKK